MHLPSVMIGDVEVWNCGLDPVTLRQTTWPVPAASSSTAARTRGRVAWGRCMSGLLLGSSVRACRGAGSIKECNPGKGERWQPKEAVARRTGTGPRTASLVVQDVIMAKE